MLLGGVAGVEAGVADGREVDGFLLKGLVIQRLTGSNNTRRCYFESSEITPSFDGNVNPCSQQRF